MKSEKKIGAIPILFLLALATDLLTPLAIWKGVLPAQIRWVSHAAIAAMLPVAYVRMMLVYGVPKVVYFAVLASAAGTVYALFQGQNLMVTAWGWWVIFQFPLVGLYAYLSRQWPQDFAERLFSFCVYVLGIQVLAQIGQYLLGQAPGDDLAGLFGWHGTGNLAVFIVFVYCLALGRWMTSERWQGVVVVLVLGIVSSALGEMKLFPVSILVLSALAVVIVTVQKRDFLKVVPMFAAAAGMLVVFLVVYDRVVYKSGFSNQSLMAFLDKEQLEKYLSGSSLDERGVYDMGRNLALAHGWNSIRKDSSTLLFGFGLGARGESRTLGTTGSALREENLAFTTGTSLLVAIQEIGIVGLLLLSISVIWAVLAIVKGIRQEPESAVKPLRYALLLFSLLWPLLLWYNHVFTLRVPMLLYWATLGYSLAESQRLQAGVSPSTCRPVPGHRLG